MRITMIVSSLLILMALGGCATWQGMQQDTHDAVDWSKKKVNEGAAYIKEKTE